MHWFTLQSDLHLGLISLFYIHFSLNFNVWFPPQCDISLWSTPQSDFTFWFPAFLFHCLTVWFNCFISTSVSVSDFHLSLTLLSDINLSLSTSKFLSLISLIPLSDIQHTLIVQVCFHLSFGLISLFNLHFSSPHSTPQSGFTIRSPSQSDFNVWFPL